MTRTLRILVSLPTRDNDFQIEQASAAERAGRELGLDLRVVFAENDAVTQSTQILQYVQEPSGSRPDAVVFEPVGGDALPRVARAARDLGIGWAVLNRSPSYIRELRVGDAAPIFSLASDHVEIGRIQGRQFSALIPDGGSILYIEGPSQSTSAKERTSGMLETKLPAIQIRTLRGQWTQESGERTVRSWLSLATSQKVVFDLIGAQDDSMAMGARKAFEQIADPVAREAWLKLPFTGCDGVPNTGQAWVRDGLLAATVYIPPLAGQAVETMTKAIRTGQLPPEYSTTVSTSIPPLKALRPRIS